MSVIPINPEFRVNTYTTGQQNDPAIAMDAEGNYVTTWRSIGQDGSGNGTYAQRYSNNGSPLGGEFRVNTYTTGQQYYSDIAMDPDGDFMIVWASYDSGSAAQDGDGSGVFGQRYSRTGAAIGSEFRVNTFTTGFQGEVAIATDAEGNFTVVWASVGGGRRGIYGQRYSSLGAKLGAEFAITSNSASEPDIAMDAEGDFVVTWDSTDGSDQGIYGQRFNAVGLPLGNRFRANTYTTANQARAAIAMDVDGDFVVTWQSYGRDGDDFGIYAQRYNRNGKALGNEFRVNQSTTGFQRDPAIAMDADGDFVVTWYSESGDGDSPGTVGQRFSRTGDQIGNEFSLNTFTTSFQWSPAIAMDRDGDFVTAWGSVDQDGSFLSIFAQDFSLPSTVQFAKSKYSVDEGDGSIKLTLTRTNTLIPATVRVKVTGGNATERKDYKNGIFPKNVSFDVGETKQKITIPIRQDGRAETTETILLGLQTIGNAELGKPSKTKVKILDDDGVSRGRSVNTPPSENDDLLGLGRDRPLASPSNEIPLSDTPVKRHLTGRDRADVFTLRICEFVVIRTFETGMDQLELPDGVSFRQLGMVQYRDHTLLEVNEGAIAKLRNMDADLLSKRDVVLT